jgi:hypothetical protein
MLKITRKEWDDCQRRLKEALRLASTHDPDLLRRIIVLECLVAEIRKVGSSKKLEVRLEVVERQLQRLGVPQYRLIRRGKF